MRRPRWVVGAATLLVVIAVAATACGKEAPALVFNEMTTTTTGPRSTPDTTVEAGPELGPWVNVTGNLAGMTSDCGNLTYVTGRPATDQVIAGVALNGLWQLGVGSDQWTPLGGGSPLKIQNRTSSIIFDPDVEQRFWESGSYSDAGVVRTDDDGRTFESLGIAHVEGLSIDFTDPDRLTMLAGIHERSELQRSTDGGRTWAPAGPPLPTGVYASQPLVVNRQTYLLGTANGPDGTEASIYRTTDAGATWTVASLGGVAGPPLVADGGIYWPLQDGGMARSTDEGATWTTVTLSGTLDSYNVVELADGRLASVGNTNAIASSDQGATWVPLGPPFPTADPWGIAYSEARNAIYLWTWDCGNLVLPGAVQRLDLTAPAPTP